jgi:Transglycosylase SLT domain
MRVLPKTGRRMARRAKTNYGTAMLLTPDYNIRLGTLYFADLLRQFGSTESALAAYNAGEDRLAFWTAGQNYPEVAAFVDSIPFTETREYLQIVMRNAEIYRKLYGAKNEPGKPRPRPPISRLGPIHSILRTTCSPPPLRQPLSDISTPEFVDTPVGARRLPIYSFPPKDCVSRSSSRVTRANRTLIDIPHINTPVTLSSGPKSRQVDGRTTSPYPTVE